MKKDSNYFKRLQFTKRLVEDYLRRTNQPINSYKVTAMVAILVDDTVTMAFSPSENTSKLEALVTPEPLTEIEVSSCNETTSSEDL